MSDDHTSITDDAAALVTRLENAWNSGDGPAFVAPFAEDADFVNVLGMHVRGRDAIAARYSMVLTRDGGEWRIASFHNTFIRDPSTMGR
jgi:hypothetical protein